MTAATVQDKFAAAVNHLRRAKGQLPLAEDVSVSEQVTSYESYQAFALIGSAKGPGHAAWLWAHAPAVAAVLAPLSGMKFYPLIPGRSGVLDQRG
jgi:hypothetical protein